MALKKPERALLGWYDEDLWTEDEDEYRLPGDWRYRTVDRDEDHEMGI